MIIKNDIFGIILLKNPQQFVSAFGRWSIILKPQFDKQQGPKAKALSNLGRNESSFKGIFQGWERWLNNVRAIYFSYFRWYQCWLINSLEYMLWPAKLKWKGKYLGFAMFWLIVKDDGIGCLCCVDLYYLVEFLVAIWSDFSWNPKSFFMEFGILFVGLFVSYLVANWWLPGGSMV